MKDAAFVFVKGKVLRERYLSLCFSLFLSLSLSLTLCLCLARSLSFCRYLTHSLSLSRSLSLSTLERRHKSGRKRGTKD